MHKVRFVTAAIIAILTMAGAAHAQQTVTCPPSAGFSLQTPAGWVFNGPSPPVPLVRVVLGPALYCSYAVNAAFGSNLIKVLPPNCKPGPNFRGGVCMPGTNGPAYCAVTCP